VMYRHGAPARLAAIVDWEMGTVGDPKLDLAWVVQGWPEDTRAAEAAESSYVDLSGMPSRAQILDHYAEVSGRQVDDIDYYVVLAKWKLAVVLEQGFQRAGDDEKLQAFGPIVLDLMQGAAELAEASDYRS
jgi:aminoglycoside phosphotransferase (APT) family kinase protein